MVEKVELLRKYDLPHSTYDKIQRRVGAKPVFKMVSLPNGRKVRHSFISDEDAEKVIKEVLRIKAHKKEIAERPKGVRYKYQSAKSKKTRGFWKISVFDELRMKYFVKSVCLSETQAHDIARTLIILGIDAKASPHIKAETKPYSNKGYFANFEKNFWF